jgi:tetratricopeptide (TPR) repeat protein
MLRAAALCILLASAAARSSTPAVALVAKGNALMRDERYDEAAIRFQEALNDDGHLLEARRNLAICRFELRQYSQARELFQPLSTGSSTADYYLARIDLLENQLDRAIRRFRAIDQVGGIEDEKFFLGLAYYKKGNFTSAIPFFEQWIKLSPRDFRAHEFLARSFARTNRRAEAAREFARTRELHNYYLEGSVALKRCATLLDQGRQTEAWNLCGNDTDDVDKISAVAMLFSRAGDDRHALLGWKRAGALDPESPENNYNLALSLFKLKDIVLSRQYVRAALQAWPDFPEANVLYGTILYMLRQDGAAIRVLTHAQELRPDDPMVRRLLEELASYRGSRQKP